MTSRTFIYSKDTATKATWQLAAERSGSVGREKTCKQTRTAFTAPLHPFVLASLRVGLNLVLVLSIAVLVLVLDVCIVLRGVLSGQVATCNQPRQHRHDPFE